MLEVEFIQHGIVRGKLVSLTPVYQYAEIKWYLCYLNEDNKLDYFWTNNLNNIIIIKHEQ